MKTRCRFSRCWLARWCSLSGTTLLGLLFLTPSHLVLAQQADSLAKEEANASSVRSTWVAPPPSGDSQKVQGGVLMGLGGLNVLVGLINLNREDPCAGIDDSPFVECISNIDLVHTVGAVQIGAGIGAFLWGMARHANGRRKARVYEEWKRKKNSVQARLSYTEKGVKVGIHLTF